jgi:hypothetical protein
VPASELVVHLGIDQCQVTSCPGDDAVIDVGGVFCGLPAEHAASFPPRLLGEEIPGELEDVRVRWGDLDDEAVGQNSSMPTGSQSQLPGRHLHDVATGRSDAGRGGGLAPVQRVAEPLRGDDDAVYHGSCHSSRWDQPTVPGAPVASTYTDDW